MLSGEAGAPTAPVRHEAARPAAKPVAKMPAVALDMKCEHSKVFEFLSRYSMFYPPLAEVECEERAVGEVAVEQADCLTSENPLLALGSTLPGEE